MHSSEDVLGCQEILNSELRFLKPHHRKPFNIDLEQNIPFMMVFFPNIFLKLTIEFLYLLCINILSSKYFLDLSKTFSSRQYQLVLNKVILLLKRGMPDS